ncbi:MAG TPA: protoporphyrinogen oxidase, partial [Opitutales bacterium]|nr:protoporphyrinogen oxidase [Opitutales bacterium]
ISFRNGLATLTETLTAKLDKQIYRETAVESIEKTDTGWQLIAKRFNRRLRDTYDAILLALPPSQLAKIEFKKNGKNLSLRELAEIPHPPVVSVSLGFSRSQVAHPLDGFGMLLPEKEQKQILGTIFASTLFPNRAPKDHVLLTTFVGGTRNPDLANASEKTIRRIVLENLQALLGIRGEPVFEKMTFWPHAIPQYNLGHGRFIQLIENFEAENPGIHIAGSTRDGIALGQCIASGRKRADELTKAKK